MNDLDRRRLVAGLAASLALAGPAAAQGRRRGRPYDPYDPGRPDDDAWPADDGPAGRSRRRDTLFDPPDAGAADPYGRTLPDPYGRDSYGPDPYGADPYGAGPRRRGRPVQSADATGGGLNYRRIYAAVDTDQFPIPAFRYTRVAPQHLRQEVAYGGPGEPGAIVIDPRAHHLHLVLGGGRAMRYGVGVGRQGFAWSGVATVKSKQEWPDWYPPKEMIARDARLQRGLSQLQSGVGMHGGPRNPLGARALYLWQNNRDTLYRIHGTTEPLTIGTSVSSGCIRMVNQDVIDLYERVSLGAGVTVLG